MAAIRNGLLMCSNFLSNNANCIAYNLQQIRNNNIGRWMIRDNKRRKLIEKYAPDRLRLVAMKRNDILPAEFREIVGKEIDEKIPRQTALRQITARCILTSRPRGNVLRWRISRIMFRHLADYNKLSGVQRAIW
ncbi:28S ribosomal protein S14, mitochondrial [Apis mellifera caucasica]|uniref:28S ribosomal protein S14, mitochondrial n=1 Tax=Apis mellifera TaxID=7460 RepID=A0A7M7FYV9_APIME|nr:28S ribosomal protein S14, mitochondrial [Apis mellifera]KAG6800611.1 28S ribosomal protein S14, mitochondrial [Apis mellifera caucasica]KAG9433563.1 28S ribosomal protein S14, mitochondrial [Apis mellifera carnica]|eukprot:XP_001120636.1 28S ribosomal protein S14, mitochondrial [Apis mellifera]